MIDEAYTEEIRAGLASGQGMVYSLYRRSEITWLIRHGAKDRTGGVLKLAEHSIARSIGIPVDLSAEAPARTTVVRSDGTPGQEHNTFTIADVGHNRRNLTTITRDRETVPKVTPQDANVAMRSLDFPTTKPAGTPLDGMRLDEKENPAEVTFVNQITVAQVLNHWKVNIDALVDAINDEWQIDFARKLIEDIALARANDLVSFLASGGRPAPSINMSPNTLSRLTFSSTPTVNPESVGYTSSFVGRCRMLVKFIMANALVMRGNGAVTQGSFHMNPAHMGTFKPEDLEGWVIARLRQVNPTPYRSSVAGMASFDMFVKCRQSAAIAYANSRVSTAKDVLRVEMAERRGLAEQVGRMTDTPHDRILAMREVGTFVKSNTIRDSDPRKLGAILFDLFNGTPSPTNYLNLVGTCGMSAVLAAVDKDSLNYAAIWRGLLASRGFGDCIRAINIESAVRNEFLSMVLEDAKGHDRKNIVAITLVMRHVNHIRPTMTSALGMAYGRVKHGKNMQTKSKAANYRGKLRPWVALLSCIEGGTKPFNQLGRFQSTATSEASQASMLEMSSALINYLAHDDAKKFTTARPLGAGIRKYWLDYYSAACRVWQNVSYAAVTLAKSGMDIQKMPNIKMNCYDSMGKNLLAFAAHMSYIEMCYSQCMALAYRWAKVRVGGIVAAALAAADARVGAAFEVEKYVTYVKSMATTEPMIDVALDAKSFVDGTLAHTDLHSRASYTLTAYGVKPAPAKTFKAVKDILTFLPDAVERVRSTVRECVMNDRHFIAAATNTTPPVDVAPAQDAPLDPVPESWEARDEPEFEVTESLSLMVARATSVVEEKNYTECIDASGLQDLLAALAGEVEEFDSTLGYVMENLWRKMTDGSYHENRVLCDKIWAGLRSINGAEPLEMEMAMDAGLREDIQLMAESNGVVLPKRDIMD